MKLVTVFAVVFASFTFAQNCRYEKNEIDKFSKTPTRITRQQTLNTRGPQPYLYVKGKNVDGFIGIGLLIQERFPTRYSIKKGDELKIALVSGEIITLKCIKEDNGRRYYGGTEYYANYIIMPDELQKIINSKVDAIRIYHSEGYTSINIVPSRQLVIPNVLRCVM
ncbi:MAG: hypothetical protein NZ519_12615 [Bacteroidia bacterium]|nr:hypothetical protein [Bacteroidia bacterium]MDW8302611.1 hypothetical protein [Bacteroidia bacterium]